MVDLTDSIRSLQVFSVEIMLRLFNLFSLRIKVYVKKAKSSGRSIWNILSNR